MKSLKTAMRSHCKNLSKNRLKQALKDPENWLPEIQKKIP